MDFCLTKILLTSLFMFTHVFFSILHWWCCDWTCSFTSSKPPQDKRWHSFTASLPHPNGQHHPSSLSPIWSSTSSLLPRHFFPFGLQHCHFYTATSAKVVFHIVTSQQLVFNVPQLVSFAVVASSTSSLDWSFTNSKLNYILMSCLFYFVLI